MLKEDALVKCVKCQVCGRLHEVGEETYYSVYGNITVGECGGLIGNNISDHGIVEKRSIFCKPNCLAKILGIETKYVRQF